MTPDAVIVGAGLGGLAAAVDLAAAGKRVLVLEASGQPGGKAGWQTVDGVSFDTGPSVVTLPDVFDALLRRADTTLADELTLRRLDPHTRYHFPDGRTLDLRADPADLHADVAAALGEPAAAELTDFLAYARRIWEAAAPHFVLGDAPTPRRLLGLLPTALRSLPQIDPLRTMNAAIDGRVHDEAVRWILQRFATYNGSDPRRAPATLHCIAHVELGLGVYGIDGGIRALVHTLVRVAERHGAEFRYHTPVAGIRREAGRVVGVTTAEGASIDAPAVVVNADVAHLVAHLLGGERHGLPAHPTPSTSGFTAVLRARRRADRPPHAVLFPTTYADEFIDLFDRDRPPADPTVYLCAQEKAHRVPGWPEHEPLFVMANAPAEPADAPRPPAVWSELRATVLRRLRNADLIDADDTIVWERTPGGLATAFPGTRGAIYGAASNDPFAAFRRPPNTSRLPGLYLASGSAHPGGGLPLCALSGVAAARAILGE